jgi:hypothetical protein
MNLRRSLKKKFRFYRPSPGLIGALDGKDRERVKLSLLLADGHPRLVCSVVRSGEEPNAFAALQRTKQSSRLSDSERQKIG